MPDRDPRQEAMGRGGLSNKRRFVVRAPAILGRPSLETTETARMTDHGFEEVSETVLHCCKTCNGAMHKLEELGGFCALCKKTLCKECSSLRCAWFRCRKCVCAEHLLDVNGQTYCMPHGLALGGAFIFAFVTFLFVAANAFFR